MAYPSSVISFSVKLDNDIIEPAHVNLLQTEVEAIESGLLNGFAHILQPSTHNTRDLGLTGTRWKDLFLAGNLDVGGSVTVPAPTAWVPVWGNSGTANTLGNGSITGRYQQIGKLVLFDVQLAWGSTTVSGNGNWSFTYPPVTWTGGNPFATVGVAYDNNVLGQFQLALAFINATTFTPSALITSGAYSQLAALTAILPFTWATNDSVSMFGWGWST